MDPALAELIEAGDADDHVRVVARMQPDAAPPPGVEVVSQFGDVATWRIRRGDLRRAWEAESVVSLKAPRALDQHPVLGWHEPAAPDLDAEDGRRPQGLPETGAGVIVACLDWGVDFAHPDFRTADGSSRLLALWDQRADPEHGTAPRYGYGVVHQRREIDAALATRSPYAALGYDPADADLGHGCHGTHCLSIAAGAGSDATPSGIAPAANLLFVHLDSPHGGDGRPLGDWVTLLDALDFCLGVAGRRPIVVSMSLGSHGGPHDGSSPLERALDFAVSAMPGRAICQSAGNYYETRIHSAGRLRPGEQDRIGWLTTRANINPHQLEVWYAGADRIVARIESGEHELSVTVAPGESRALELGGLTIGRIHHRTGEPNNGKNHVNAFLYPAAPGGRWEIVLEATDVADGRYHCWVERESGSPSGQSHLDDTQIVKRCTTNSVCNGLRTITVGAYDALSPERPLAPFSSSGPTSDGRMKPDLTAPGVRILAARSTPRGQDPGARATRMSGTSMAAPYVAGTVALMFEAAGRPLTIAKTRAHLSRAAESAGFTDERGMRVGDGYVDIERAVEAARPAPELTQEETVDNLDKTAVMSGAAQGGGSLTGSVLDRLGVADSPAGLFDALRSGSSPSDRPAGVMILAGPGSKLGIEPRAGDILLSRIRGERDGGRLVVLSNGTIHDRERCRALGDRLRDSGRGLYAHVITDHGDEILAVRITDSGRRLPAQHMLIRPADDLWPLDAPVWQGERWADTAPPWAPESGPVPAGRLVVDAVPLLASHRGTHPDLILRWNAMPDGVSTVDVVVHFHGYSGRAAAMRLDVDKEPKSGLDFSNPADPSDPRPGRVRPTLCILPRGNYFGGRSGAGYDHPALVTPRGLQDLISFAMERFGSETGARPSIGRLILTAHSGGGAGLMGALRHNDPHEVQVFDALYGPADALADWAQNRIRAELAGSAAGSLRILFIEGAGTSEHSLAVARGLDPLLQSASAPGVADRYRAQATSVAHNEIPRRFGWLLLADPGARLAVQGAGHGAETTTDTPAERNGSAPASAVETDDATLRAQWDAHPRVHGWFEGGLDNYVGLAPLYANHGIPDAAAYLDQNITTAHLLGHAFPAHRSLAAALAQADAALATATPAPDVHSIWAVNARPIRGQADSLSQHALGLAVDINPATNPRIRARHDADVVRVITAVTGVDLGSTQTADALRQASTTFRTAYGDEWLAARRQELDAAVQSGDTGRAGELRAVLAAAGRQATGLRELARTGFLNLDPRLIDALQAAGLTWGGSWRTSKDFMHFELHVATSTTAAQSAEGIAGGVVTAAMALLTSCAPGEGPAAPEPDPSGRAPHPLILPGSTHELSRRPTVGYAQQCLNEFLARYQAGATVGSDNSATTRGLIDSSLETLRGRGQLPLIVDCRFGPSTELATKAFQAANGVTRDGKIGPITWPLLDAFAPSTPSPVPPFPAPPPPAPPSAAPALSALEGRYFPPPGTADAAPFSRASTFEPIVDGRDYFAAIKARIDALGTGDACYLAGWWFSAGFTFADGTALGDLLVAKAAAGVDVRVIVWVNRQVLDSPRLAGVLGAGPYSRVIHDNIAAAEDLRARVAGGGAVLAGRVLIDWSGNAASSHHQKFAVVSHGGDVAAFIGGLDFQQNRLSPPMHPPPNLGWHDAGVLVRGDGAGRALQTFVTRWNEAATLSPATYDVGAGSHQYNPAPITPLHPPAATTVGASADTSVQVVRTFPDSKEFGLLHNTPWRTLPSSGVHEVKRTFQTALAAAQRYIYIEDQSFDAVDSLFPALVAACRRGVKVIALIPGIGDPLDTPGKIPATLTSVVQSGIVDRLSASERANLAVWQLDAIVVHAKLILIDDEFASIGSANFMDRSMQFTFQGDDSELTAAAVSTGTLVSDLRVQLWAEHLRVTDPAALAEIRDLARSLGFWRPAWGSGLSFAHASSRLVFVGPGAGSPAGGGTAPRSSFS